MLENLLGYILFGSVISFASPWLVPILTVAPIVNILSVKAYNKWEYAHRSKMTDLNQKLGHVEELPDDFAAAKDIRIYSMASWLRECYRDLSDQRSKWDRNVVKKSFLSRIADLVVILIRDGGAYALLIHMFYSGKIGIDEFVLYFAAISSFASWVGDIISCWNKANTVSLKLCDFRDFVDYPEYDGSGIAKATDHMNTVPEIEFKNVSFRYDGAEQDTIHDLSLKIKSGEKLALVGLNGAGKTTLVKLLCGLYRPTSGEIFFNGIPLSDFKREDYYKLISPVFQEIRTAFFSLAETVSGKSTAETDLEKAETCMRQAGLGAKIDALPDGIHTKLNKKVHENGTELSGGEAQKLIYAALKGGITVGSIAKYVTCIMLLVETLINIVTTTQQALYNNHYLKRYFSYFDIPNNMYQGSLTVEKRDDNEYYVEFRNVSFKYPNTEAYALRNVNLKFKIGEKLAIVGMNGSGKTTFIKLLCRLYDPTEGEILLNGVNIQKYDYDEYMSVFSVVFQDFSLFSFKIGEVVASSKTFDENKVRECLVKANFGDRLHEMPEGIHTYLYKGYDQSGIEISGGEAQKIALARALYKDSPFILLDEPTAALDPISEYEVYSNFNAISGDKTTVYISHRLASCRFCNKIVVFDDGKIVQHGSHEELLSDVNGKYHELWNAQAQYYTT